MISVNGAPAPPPGPTPHVAALGDGLLVAVRRGLARHDWGGLRPSHHRLLSHVPAAGTTVTDLAPVLRMTKQAVGQFVAHLEGTGHLSTTPDPADGRRRVVRRTTRGDAAVAAVEAGLADLEREWEQRVGAERYRTFREVLLELSGT